VPNVFFSYSHHDEGLRDQLETQLAMLKHQGIIETWHDRRIGAGREIDAAIDEHINQDEIILLLVSPDFIASNYCYNIEMRRALDRHDAGEAIVIPVILRACEWHHAPFGKLLATPRDGKPITQWPDRDEAFLQVAKAVREAATRYQASTGTPSPQKPAAPASTVAGAASPRGPRSSNLRLAKAFSQKDKDEFKLDTFEYIMRFFENSLTELAARNPGYEGVFRRVDANRFFATIYKDGKDVARATIFIGGGAFGNGINYVHGETTGSNSINETLSVDADDQMLYLTTMGMAILGQDRERKLSQEGAAELLWDLVIAPPATAPRLTRRTHALSERIFGRQHQQSQRSNPRPAAPRTRGNFSGRNVTERHRRSVPQWNLSVLLDGGGRKYPLERASHSERPHRSRRNKSFPHRLRPCKTGHSSSQGGSAIDPRRGLRTPLRRANSHCAGRWTCRHRGTVCRVLEMANRHWDRTRKTRPLQR